MGAAVAIASGAVVGFAALLWLIVGCYRCGGAARTRTDGVVRKAERDGGLAVLEGGVQIAQTVVGFDGCSCCGGDGVFGGGGGGGGCGGYGG